MLRNYASIALRTVRKHTGYTVLNVGGLAVGLATCLLVLLFVRHEYRYDRHHANADRIVRLTVRFGDFGAFAKVPASVSPYIADHYPEVEAATRLLQREAAVQKEDEWIREQRFYYAEPSAFDVFTLPLKAGDPSTALTEPGTVVLTSATARRYFGTADPLGRTVVLNTGQTFRVTGVVEDPPETSHLPFDWLASFSTLPAPASPFDYQGFTYLLLAPSAPASALQAKLDTLTDQGLEALQEAFGWGIQGLSFELQPLTGIHLTSHLNGEAEPNGDLRTLYVFAIIALFILVMASINYMNLATAQSVRRAREVGIRKVFGAHRVQLVGQFLGESLLFSFLALFFALVLLEGLIPFFNDLSGTSLRTSDLLDPTTALLTLAVVCVNGLLAGSYPSVFLSRFRPVRVLKGLRSRWGSGVWVRRGLVTFQFTLSVTLIAGTLVVLRQVDYMRSKRLGYDTEQILTLPMRGALKTQQEAFREALLAVPGIENVSRAAGPPVVGMTTTAEVNDEEVLVRFLAVDPNYLDVMGMSLVKGRNFSSAFATDTSAVLMNETAARLFGVADRVGQPLERPFRSDGEQPLIGIVSDFHVASLHEPIMPTVIEMDPATYAAFVVRLEPAAVARTLEQIEADWRRFVPDQPFSYTFLDDMLAEQYAAEQRLGRIFTAFSALAVLIACLGLFGLAAFTAEQRTKEIGIRKVLGATIPGLVMLLTQEFTRFVGIAFILAVPITYAATRQWLDDFAFRIDLSWGIFISAGLTALGVALLTVGYQAVKAARANPVKSLRYE